MTTRAPRRVAPRGMMLYHTIMPKAKIAITLDADLLGALDREVARGAADNRSAALEQALARYLADRQRHRLDAALDQVDPAAERRDAERGFSRDVAEWEPW